MPQGGENRGGRWYLLDMMRLLVVVCLAAIAARAEPLVLEGTLDGPEGGFAYLPFEVPEGIREIEVRHDDLSKANIIDWGLDDPNGFRGWGGGNPERVFIGESMASRSYLAGPIPAGRWRVVMGLARINERPINHRVEITLRTTPSRPVDPTLAPYVPAPPIMKGRRWYAGDLHVHSWESGDSYVAPDEVAVFARSRSLDFVELSDHNTTAQLWRMADVQPRNPDVLLIPGVEFTTYAGHANGIGATRWVNHRIGDSTTIEEAAAAFAAQGAVLSINHPVLDLGKGCIGCSWKHVVPESVGAVEIGTGAASKTGRLFGDSAIAWWDALLDEGRHLAPVGGSDDHSAGHGRGLFDSPIGSPTTRVLADELSVEAIVAGIRAGRTVVQLEGPNDPMVELTSRGEPVGCSLVGEQVEIHARVTGGRGHQLQFVVDGGAREPVTVDADPFDATLMLESPPEGETRVRAEVLVEGRRRTVTGHLWFSRGAGERGGCHCNAIPQAMPLALVGLLLRRRRSTVQS